MGYVASCGGRAPVVVSAAVGMRLRGSAGWRLLREATPQELEALGDQTSALLSDLAVRPPEALAASSYLPMHVDSADVPPVAEPATAKRRRG